MARSTLLQVLSGALQILSYTVAQDDQGQNSLTPNCQPVTYIPLCEDMPWNYTLFPNFRGHSSQTEANQELEQFRQLIEVNCSGAIVIFLCSIYAPFCSDDPPLRVLPPCKRLCQHVRDGCEPVFNERAGGLPWPDHLNCDNYEDNHLCFGPQEEELNEVTIPPQLLGQGGETTGTKDIKGNTDRSMPKSTYVPKNIYPSMPKSIYVAKSTYATSSIPSKCHTQ